LALAQKILKSPNFYYKYSGKILDVTAPVKKPFCASAPLVGKHLDEHHARWGGGGSLDFIGESGT
jgi:hypothetical protein